MKWLKVGKIPEGVFPFVESQAPRRAVLGRAKFFASDRPRRFFRMNCEEEK